MARTGFRPGDRARAKSKFLKLSPTIRRHVTEALRENAEELTEAIRRRVPVDDGDLRDSVQWAKGLPKGKLSDGSVREAGAQADLSVRVVAGDKRSFYAPFVEFGSRDTPAQPFFFPTYRALKRKLKARLSRAVGKAVKEVQGG